jgi:NitT/TauT family transport system ATP-binding protein
VTNEAKIGVSGVSRVFGPPETGFLALDGMDVTVAKGEFLCIVGPSGCGKSTLLRMLGGLDVPSSGSISLYHEDSTRLFDAMIFQQESVFPWMTVAQNAAYGLRTTGNWKGRESEEKVNYFLEATGLLQFRHFYPSQLSGGMKQRLASFARSPPIPKCC